MATAPLPAAPPAAPCQRDPEREAAAVLPGAAEERADSRSQAGLFPPAKPVLVPAPREGAPLGCDGGVSSGSGVTPGEPAAFPLLRGAAGRGGQKDALC